MELNQLMKLVEAGFTKEDIIRLSEAAEPQKAPVQVSEPAPIPEPSPSPDKPALLEAQEKQIEALNASIGELSEKIRQMNLLSAVMPESAVKPVEPKDLIGKIINPYTKKEV